MKLQGSRIRPRGTDTARVIQVLETRALLGRGTDEDPVRVLIQYWDFEGKLLAYYDSLDDVYRFKDEKQVGCSPKDETQ